tara:strand:- start:262 stop:990 length:729 start_codon:yes stop_codon:yes gene_type:complete
MIQQTLDLLPQTTESETYVYTPSKIKNQTYPFIWESPKALSKLFCKKVIRKFLKDPEKYAGMVGEGRVDKRIKDSLDLQISNWEKWSEEDDVFFKSLTKGSNEYQEALTDEINLTAFEKLGHQQMTIDPSVTNQCIDTGYQLQETKPGSYYDWHHDFDVCKDGDTFMIRKFTYLWYLNDDFDGGETEFYDGTLIKPETGKLIIFPATWSFYHRGRPPKNGNKYICTGWMHDGISTAVLDVKY